MKIAGWIIYELTEMQAKQVILLEPQNYENIKRKYVQ